MCQGCLMRPPLSDSPWMSWCKFLNLKSCGQNNVINQITIFIGEKKQFPNGGENCVYNVLPTLAPF